MGLMLETGIIGKEEMLVTEADTAKALGSGGLNVFATPAMIALSEKTALTSILKELPEGQSTVGTKIDMSHIAATPVGMRVRCETELIEIDRRRLVFSVNVFDEVEKIAEGTHERFIVDNAKFQTKADAKIDAKAEWFRTKGYVRFGCSDIDEAEKRETCINLVQDLEIENCNNQGNLCEIYITKYRLAGPDGNVWFKTTVENNEYKSYEEVGTKQDYINRCKGNLANSDIITKCTQKATKKIFRSGFKDYIELLPDYKTESVNHANYRVIISIHHQKDSNNYYSYSTIEVNR